MKSHSIELAWCKGCGICVAFCPKKALSIDLLSQKAMWAEDKCIFCGLCEHYCPDLAITVVNDSRNDSKNDRKNGTDKNRGASPVQEAANG